MTLLRQTTTIVLLAGLLAGSSFANVTSFNGEFISDSDQASFRLTLAEPETISILTGSYVTGGFAPDLSLFALNPPDPLLIGQDAGGIAGGAGNPGCGPRSISPTTGLCLDAYLVEGASGPLAAGQYLAVVTDWTNPANGPFLSNGFANSGGAGVPGVFTDPLGNVLNGNFSVSFSGADSVVPLSGVPEPSAMTELAVGLSLIAVAIAPWKRKNASIHRGFGGVLIAGALMLPSGASAQTSYTAADTYTSSGNPTVNFGTFSTMTVGGGNSALIQIDLSRLIAAGIAPANVQQASLTIYVNKVLIAGGADISLVTSPWTESGTSGVTYSTAPTAAIPFLSNVPISNSNSFVTIDVTSQVQGWLSGVPNNGIQIVAAAAAPSTAFLVDTKESATTSHPAIINVLVSSSGSAFPSGAVVPFNAASCPSGWSDMPALAGRAVVGVGSGAGLTPRNLGDTGGEERHTMATAELVPFFLSMTFGASNIGGQGGGLAYDDGAGGAQVRATYTKNTNTIGSGQPFNVMAPWYALRYCAKQ